MMASTLTTSLVDDASDTTEFPWGMKAGKAIPRNASHASLSTPRLHLLDPMCSPIGSPFDSPRTDASGHVKLEELTPAVVAELNKLPEATLLSSWCVLTNTMLGVGILSIPSAISHMGVTLGSCMLLSACAISAFALHLLSVIGLHIIGFSQGPTDITFYSVCTQIAPRARFFVDIAIALKCFGVATSYLQVVGQLGAAFAADIHFGDSSVSDILGGEYHARCCILFTVVIAVIAPVVFHKRITKTVFQNAVAIGSWLYIAVLTLCFATGLLALPDAPQQAAGSWQMGIPEDMTFKTFASSIPVFIFSFTCHQNMFPIASELKGRTVGRLDSVLLLTAAAGMSIYTVTGLGGYTMFGEGCLNNFLLNLPSTWPVCIGRLLVIMAVIFTYPLQLHPCRRSIMILIEAFTGHQADRDEQRMQRRIITVCILVTTTSLAVLVNNLGVTLGFVGAVGSNTVVIIMPSFLYLKMFSRKRDLTWFLALILFLMGLVILPTCLGAVIVKMLDGP